MALENILQSSRNLIKGIALGTALYFSGCSNSSDKDNINSQTSVFQLNTSETRKIDSLNALAFDLKYSEPGKAFEILRKSKELSEKINYQKGLADAYSRKGTIFLVQGDYGLSEANYFQALEIYKKIPDSIKIADIYNNLGLNFSWQGKYKESAEYYINALKIYDKMADSASLALTSGNLGVIFLKQGNKEKALEYLLKDSLIKQRILLKNPNNLEIKSDFSITLGNLGTIHSYSGEDEKAINYYFESMKFADEVNNKNQESICIDNLVNIYQRKGEFDLALDYLRKGIQLDNEIGNKRGLAWKFMNLGRIQKSKKIFSSSIKSLNQALAISKEINNPELIRDIYAELTEAYESKKDFSKAFEYYRNYNAIRDSVFNLESSARISEIDNKYKMEKKDVEIKLLNKEQEIRKNKIKEQRRLIWGSAVALGLISLLSLGLSNLNRKKQKAYKLLDRQKKLIEEKNKEINDSLVYAKKIQTAVLPSETYADSILGNHFIIFKPKDVVSGDFYWATRVNEWLIVTVADCTGHGVPGAFMSMLGVSYLNEIVRKKEVTNAADVLNYLRSSVIDALKQTGKDGTQKDGMDMSLAAINRNNGQCQWAGANNPLWLIRNTSLITECIETPDIVEEIKADKMPVAVHINMANFKNHELQLETGDTLFLFSDGMPDQFGGEKGKKFMYGRFKKLLASTSSLPMKVQREHIVNELEKWKNGFETKYEQTDDITIMGIKI